MRYLRSCSSVWLVLALVALVGVSCSSESKKARYFARAERYFLDGEYEKARIEYMNVLRLEPTHQQSVARVATIYFDRGQMRAALPFLAAARRLNSNDVTINFKIGMALVGARRFDEARQQADAILQVEPGNSDGILLLAETVTSTNQIAGVWKQIQDLQSRVGTKPAFDVAFGNLLLKQRNVDGAERSMRQAIKLDEQFAPAYLGLGNIQWLKGQTNEAEKSFDTVAKLAPVRSPMQYRRVELKLASGATEEAKKMVQEITAKAPDQIAAWTYLARIAFQEGNFDECEPLLAKVLGYDDLHYEALLMQARISLAKRKPEDAFKALEKLAQTYPNSAEVFYYTAMTHMANQDLAKAMVNANKAASIDPNSMPSILLVAELQGLNGDMDGRIKTLLPLLQRQPNLIPAQLLLATAYRQQGKLDEVLKIYQKMAELSPNQAHPQFVIGITYRQQKKFAEARKAFLKVREMDPEDVRALGQLVDLDVEQKDYASAHARLNAEVAKRADVPELWVLKAAVERAQNNLDEAEKALLKAIEIDPGYRSAYPLLAQLYIATGRPDQALDKLNAGLSKTPNDTSALMLRGMIYEQKKDVAKAQESYEKVIEINPRFTAALNNLAYLLLEHRGNHEKAYEYARKARDLNPRDPHAADTLGWVLYHRGEYRRALALLQECLDKMPDTAEVLYHVGMAQYMLGIEDGARVNLETALASGKDFAGKEAAQKRLSLLKTDIARGDAGTVRMLEDSVKEEPRDFCAWIRLAAIYDRDGEGQKAKSAYEKAIELNPGSQSARFGLARLYAQRLNDKAKALEIARAALANAPDDPQVIAFMGPLLFDAGDFSAALGMLQTQNRRQPNQPEVLYALGLSLYGVGQIPDAVKAMQDALKADPNFPNAPSTRDFLSLVALSSDAAKAEQAETAVMERLKQNPRNLPASIVGGMIHERKGNTAAARQVYENILGVYPRFALAAKRLGILIASSANEDAKAMELLTRARETFPRDPEIAKALGIVTYRRGDYGRSVQFLREAVGASTSDVEALYYIGLAQTKMGRKADGQQTLQQALGLDGKHKLADEARKVMAEK